MATMAMPAARAQDSTNLPVDIAADLDRRFKLEQNRL
jgi:hypothetical protein